MDNTTIEIIIKILYFLWDNSLWIVWIIIAIQWLNTWKKQLKWNAEYETARKTLHLIYKIRYGVETIRAPFMSVYEMQVKWDFKNASEREIRAAWVKEAYIKRSVLLNETKNKLFVDILEAEVLWWREIKKLIYDLIYEVRKLEIAISNHIEILNNKEYDYDEYWKKRSQEVCEIIYAKSLNWIEIIEEDKYALNLEEKIKFIENYLKPYLNK